MKWFKALLARLTPEMLPFVASSFLVGAIASVVQTQVNLAEVISLGAPVKFVTRVVVTFEDLARFGPIMFGIAIVAMFIAACIASFLQRYMSGPKSRLLYAAAGGFGLWLTFKMLGYVTPMNDLVNATKTSYGLTLVCMAGLIGGITYASCYSLVHKKLLRHDVTPRRLVAASAVLILIPLLSFAAMAPKDAEPIEKVDATTYTVQVIASDLFRPWSVAFLPDGRKLIAHMTGKLVSLGADGAVTELDTTELPAVYNKRRVSGMMEVIVDPKFIENRFIYITTAYGTNEANGSHLVRARLNGTKLSDVRIIFTSPTKVGSGNNGGRMTFLPDETIALTVGDGNDRREAAQNPASYLGKVIRIDRDGKPANGNSFVNTDGYLPNIFTLGHRNPQGIAFDSITNALLVTEHGPRGGDEINVLTSGGNYGWPAVTHGIDYSFAHVTPHQSQDQFVGPILHWTPSIAPSGLAIYRGNQFPEWDGHLLVPALKERAIRLVFRSKGKVVEQKLLLSERGERIRDVKVATDGSIYVISDGDNGSLLRLVSSRTASGT